MQLVDVTREKYNQVVSALANLGIRGVPHSTHRMSVMQYTWAGKVIAQAIYIAPPGCRIKPKYQVNKETIET